MSFLVAERQATEGHVLPFFRDILHQVHCHSFDNFEEVLTQLFRVFERFLSIGYNDFNLSSSFQANSDHMRKAE